MKYVSLLLLLYAMSYTWGLAHRKQAIPEQTHVGIQEDLKRVITDYIQENLPNSKNLIFKRFWTEPLSEEKVKASFVYSFEDANEQVGEARVEISGQAILSRQNETEETSIWSLDDLSVTSSQVDYKDPLNVE